MIDNLKKIDIIIPDRKIRERIDKFLTHQIENASRSRIQQLIKAQKVLVNGKIVKQNYIISPKEIVTVYVPAPKTTEAVPENIPLNIVYEDGYLIVVNKPAGMVVHPAHGNYTGTLVNALLYHCKNLSGINGEIRAGVVHRLDKDTSGLIVSAKDDVTHRVLSLQFSKKTTERTYYAIVWRKFKNKEGIIETLIGRSISDRKKMSVPQGGAGKLAITKYKVLKEFEFLSLIELKLETGRTHQIRVHLAHVQHPVFGDPTYSGRGNQLGSLPDKLRKKAALLLTMINRQALHAKTLGFVHPATKQKMLFDSELPDDIKNILEKLDND